MNTIIHRILGGILFLLCCVSAVAAPPAPTVTTGAATSILQYGATLNGTVNPSGNSGLTVFFDYGATTSYGNSMQATPGTVSGSTTLSVSANVTGLSGPYLTGSGTFYHYRLRVQNGIFTYYGSDQIFMTLPSNNANLTDLSLWQSIGNQIAWSSINGTNYTANVPFAQASVYIGITPAQGNATVQVNGNGVNSGGLTGPYTLGVGANVFNILVTAQDGVTQKTYTVTVNRATPSAATQPATAIGTTGATLNGIVNPNGSVTTAQFEYGFTTSYGSTASVTLSPNNGTANQSVSVTIGGLSPGTVYHYRITATSTNGTSAGGDATFTTISNNANLSDITLGTSNPPGLPPVALTPGFSPFTTSYTATVPNSATGIYFGLSGPSNATAKINNNTAILGLVSGPFSLAVGVNNFNIVVTAQDGVTTKTYTVAVTRQTANESWRQIWYGSSGNSGNAANNADPYHTGVPNLLVFAFFGPNQNPSQTVIGQLPRPQLVGGNFFYSFTEPAGVSGVTYGAEWTADLVSGIWIPVTDSGSGQVHTFSVPVGSNTRLSMRLKATGL